MTSQQKAPVHLLVNSEAETSPLTFSVNEMLQVGEYVAGYQILNQIGKGGYGAVYQALDEGLDRTAATAAGVPVPASQHAFSPGTLSPSNESQSILGSVMEASAAS